jgi:hypothetical protein
MTASSHTDGFLLFVGSHDWAKLHFAPSDSFTPAYLQTTKRVCMCVCGGGGVTIGIEEGFVMDCVDGLCGVRGTENVGVGLRGEQFEGEKLRRWGGNTTESDGIDYQAHDIGAALHVDARGARGAHGGEDGGGGVTGSTRFTRFGCPFWPVVFITRS